MQTDHQTHEAAFCSNMETMALWGPEGEVRHWGSKVVKDCSEDIPSEEDKSLAEVGTTLFGKAVDALGITSVVAAMLDLSILLLLGILDWDDCLSEKSAWDTLAWFAVLVGM
ncbi:hypothetical protein RJ639_041900 [Escallonia herrerae]|uniref:Uncharacterized protein n=1 Tax=Escallonia herrerae TaxID=1293975 RepID=A0AA88WI95_9ASTE|nr:hypothetical protein RJ639_041900 [Escallonia herrerae]